VDEDTIRIKISDNDLPLESKIVEVSLNIVKLIFKTHKFIPTTLRGSFNIYDGNVESISIVSKSKQLGKEVTKQFAFYTVATNSITY
jgi:hypothetical protein